MKKILATLLALVLLVSCVPALAEVPEGYPEIKIDPKTGKPYDLGGITVYVYQSSGTKDGSRPEATTALQMDTYDYQDWLMETYNFKMVEIFQFDFNDQTKELLNFASQETAPVPAVFRMSLDGILAPLRNDLLRDMGGYEFIDVQDGEVWNQGVVDIFTKDNQTLALSDNFGVSDVLYFNRDLLEDSGYTSDQIYEWIENGEWDFDKYAEVLANCTRDIDNDGVIDVYGMVGNGQPEFKSAVVSNGGAFFRVDSTGKFYLAANEQATIDAMEWAEELWYHYNYPQPAGSSWDYYYEAFKSGKAVFYMGAMWELQNGNPLYGLEDNFDFGVAVFPMGTGPAAAYRQCKSPDCLVMPANVSDEDAWKVMFALNEWHTATPGYSEEDEAWKASLYQTFSDERDVDIVCQILRDNTFVDVTAMIGTPNDMIGQDFIWSITLDWTYKSHTVAELIEGKLPVWNAALAKANGEEIAAE